MKRIVLWGAACILTFVVRSVTTPTITTGQPGGTGGGHPALGGPHAALRPQAMHRRMQAHDRRTIATQQRGLIRQQRLVRQQHFNQRRQQAAATLAQKNTEAGADRDGLLAVAGNDEAIGIINNAYDQQLAANQQEYADAITQIDQREAAEMADLEVEEATAEVDIAQSDLDITVETQFLLDTGGDLEN